MKKKALNGKASNGKAGFKEVKLSYHTPDAQSVLVTGTFCDWRTDRYALTQDGNGSWKRTIVLAPGRYEYRFIVDGEWVNDPNCADRVVNEFGGENCVLQV